MQLETWLLFIGTTFFVSIAPGPNNLLAMFNGARHGVSAAAVGGIGRLIAFALMITVTAMGLGIVLGASEIAFGIIKWGGAIYLVYLGLKSWFAKVSEGKDNGSDGTAEALMPYPGAMTLARTEFFTAIGNPKAILFFTALFPQFLAPDVAYGGQFAVMGATFIALEGTVLLGYGLIGGQVKGVIRSARHMRWLNRISGSLLMAAGVLLAFTSRSRSAV
ncbi:LysE family translocator [Thalassospira lucentensis]|uniref:LysE family translocator n=1 Tax=Thalassospira lucentensis TaxID=168935 RepID=A0A358HSU6_9PROT|nr:LysE family translocator [Thalassospira lucentensis]RCK22595.1 lysine transporter LysE [Thalassospira lucentensis MCCC 1A00383 = DSM 14000]HBU97864.1 LysE family translocator [Thalassospira lucentensis]HCW68288.1 LysE family translocator [Thalassospira lucentensis]